MGARTTSVTMAAALALVLLQLIMSASSCGATKLPQASGPDGSQARMLSSSSNQTGPDGNLPPGYNYRPPLVDFKYLGGHILWKPIHVYFVWYGTWTDAEKAVITTVVRSLTPPKPIQQFPNLSNLWKIVSNYYEILPDGKRRYGTSQVLIAGEVDDPYSAGTTIDVKTAPAAIIKSHLGKGLPFDLEQGVYFILTSANVTFTTDYNGCGYHFYECIDPSKGREFCGYPNPIPQNNLVYSFVPIPSAANGFNVCNVFGAIQGTPPNYLVSPDGALDAAISVLMHELLELSVDPYVNAWDYNPAENSETADVCSYTYIAGDFYYCGLPDIYPDYPGGVNQTLNPYCESYANYVESALVEPTSGVSFNQYGVDGSMYLVQKFWSLASKGCASQAPQEACDARPLLLNKATGTIQRGYFFNGVGLQAYAPGQHCRWEILVPKAREIRLVFEVLALGYDVLDYVDITQSGVFPVRLTRFGQNLMYTYVGSEPVFIDFVTFSGKSPYPASAGFIMRYTAVF